MWDKVSKKRIEITRRFQQHKKYQEKFNELNIPIE